MITSQWERMEKELTVILGMHRSGTSVITRAMPVLGLSLGNSFIPPQNDNPKGFWEDQDIYKINIEILSALNSEWDSIAPIESRDVDILIKNGYFQRAIDLLGLKCKENPIFAFKDPRIAKLLPFWKLVFDYCQYKINYIITIRHPFSVAESLKKRNEFEREKSFFLWIGYVISSLAGTNSGNRIIVDYDLLIKNPRHELHRIARFFGLKVYSDKLEEYIAEFLDRKLQHTVFSLDDFAKAKDCPPLVTEVYSVLYKFAENSFNEEDNAILKERIVSWDDELNRQIVMMKLVDRLYSDINEMNRVAFEKEQQVAALKGKISEQNKEIENLSHDIREKESEIENFRSSASWKITRPCRRVGRLARRLYGAVSQLK